MTLEEIAAGAPALDVLRIGGDVALARQIQARLADLGLLDPPVDGSFGPVSRWALGEFLKRGKLPDATFDAAAARALLDPGAASLFPLTTPNTLAGRLVKAMQAKRHWISRHPDCVNIVYVEGLNDDGTRNADAPNEFNDLRLVLRVTRMGTPQIVDQWEATTEPGRFFTIGPQAHPLGAARIAFGQYKSWSVGTHNASKPSGHEALVQTADIDIFRDRNRDFERPGDTAFTGMFHINQHWGFDLPKTDIRNASAGCLVGRTKTGHRAFMALCKADARFKTNNSYRFMTAVLPAAEV